MSPTETDRKEILDIELLRLLRSPEFQERTQGVEDKIKKFFAIYRGGIFSEEIEANASLITHADPLTLNEKHDLNPDLKCLVYVNFLGDNENNDHVTIEGIPFPREAILNSIKKYGLDYLRSDTEIIYIVLTNSNSNEILILEIPPLSNTENITIKDIKEFHVRKTRTDTQTPN